MKFFYDWSSQSCLKRNYTFLKYVVSLWVFCTCKKNRLLRFREYAVFWNQEAGGYTFIFVISNIYPTFVTVSLGGKISQAEEKEKKFRNIIKNVKKELTQAKEQVLNILNFEETCLDQQQHQIINNTDIGVQASSWMGEGAVLVCPTTFPCCIVYAVYEFYLYS